LKVEKKYIAGGLAKDIQAKKKDRDGIVSEIFGKKLEKIQHYEEIYKPLTDVLDDEKEAQEKADSVLAFSVEPVFNKEAFVRQFEKYIDQRGRGNFRGKSDGMKKLIEILDAHDLKDSKSTLRLISEIMDILNFEQIEDKKIEVDLDKQLLVSRSELYDFLFSIDFVDVSYNLRFNGKELSEDQFSPGEKGAMLLIFYLLIEKGKVPLIIDQPEENLDNESVFDLLVPYIRRAKKERQVILVTHNPNLAVVCDAEQIIHTTMNKKKSTIRYAWGSLEDVATNKRVSAVLEGTLPAFDVRNSKYYRK
jgi:DNA repair exonuclease SbcCD ATPase subunit